MKRTSIISILVIMAFAMMGIGFAMWSDTVSITAAATTGELKFGFVSGTDTSKDVNFDPQGDWTCALGLDQVTHCPENKNVGSTETALLDTDGDNILDKLTVTVNNAYPCYYNHIDWDTKNYGTIPFIIQTAKLTWLDNEPQEISSKKLYVLCQDGSILLVPPDKQDSQEELDEFYTTNNGVIEFLWGDCVSYQVHPNEFVDQSLAFHVLQPAQQETTYSFSLSIQGIQWNESPIPATQHS